MELCATILLTLSNFFPSGSTSKISNVSLIFIPSSCLDDAIVTASNSYFQDAQTGMNRQPRFELARSLARSLSNAQSPDVRVTTACDGMVWTRNQTEETNGDWET